MKILIIILLNSLISLAQDFRYDSKTGQAVPDFIGELKELRGVVKKKGTGPTLSITNKSKFYEKEIVFTEKNSLAKILMVDDTLLTIGPNSRFDFQKFSFTDKSNRQSDFHLESGQIRVHVRNKAKTGDLNFKTQYSALGVRGTEFLMNRHKVKELEVTEFALLDGEVEITTDNKEQFKLQKLDHLILVNNKSRNMASEKTKLDPEMVESMKDKEKLLPLINLNEKKLESKFKHLLTSDELRAESSAEESSLKPSSNSEDAKWKKSLKKLNKHLEENRQKKSKN